LKVRRGQPGRPVISRQVRDLIRKMCRENRCWGAPRIHGELLKLGIDIGETSVSKYLVRCRKPPSQTWRTFLENHAQQLVSIDFFTVPTIRFQVLYVFLVLAHDRRRILHFNVTAHPTAQWTAQQLREAFPFDQLPRYLLRDRDAIFGFVRISITITGRERIFRWGRTHRSRERFSRRKWGPSWQCRKSADCTSPDSPRAANCSSVVIRWGE
jgi:putative transposase